MAEKVYSEDKIGYYIETHAGELLELNAWGPISKIEAFKTFLNIMFDPVEFETDMSIINHDNGYSTLSFLRRMKERKHG